MASDCKVKDRETVEKEIRALLVSSKRGCTPKQLQDAYLQFVGESVPYHYLGFTSFMAFIDDMSDVVSVCRSRSNTVLYGIADKKTQNIKNLVSKQRDKKEPPWTDSAPRMNMLTTTTTTKPAPKEPEVPPDFKVRLRELMQSYPNGLPLKLFNETFAKRFGYLIAFRNYGFSSIEAMVRSVPDVLEIQKDTTRNIEMVRRVFPLEMSRRCEGSGGGSGEGRREQTQPRPPPPPPPPRSINWYHVDRERQSDIAFATKPPKQAPSLSLNSLELSPQMRKKLLKAPAPEEKTKKRTPWLLAGKIKKLLLTNKMGIWVSRFLVVYQVRRRWRGGGGMGEGRWVYSPNLRMRLSLC